MRCQGAAASEAAGKEHFCGIRLCQKFAQKKAEAERCPILCILNRNMLRKVAVNMACAA